MAGRAGRPRRPADNLGSLTVHRGRVARIFEASGGGLTVLLADDVVIPAAKVVLAVGNQAPAQPFPVSADVSGYVRGAVRAVGQLYPLGPARRGVLWETTAVPEIRAQARALATHLIPMGRPIDGALGWSRADSAYPLPG